MKWTAMDKGFLLIVMEISIQMFAEDLPSSLFSAGSSRML